MINWEEFGRSQLARTALNLSQLCRSEASDLAFHRKAVARKMIGPHSHRGGHWFDPSIAHQVSGHVDLRRVRHGSHSCSRPRQMPVRWPSCDLLQAFTTNVITLLKSRGG